MELNSKIRPFKKSNVHVVNKPINAIEVIRQKSMVGDVSEEPLYICNISDIIRKHHIWKQCMPRVKPFYGEFKLFNQILFKAWTLEAIPIIWNLKFPTESAKNCVKWTIDMLWLTLPDF